MRSDFPDFTHRFDVAQDFLKNVAVAYGLRIPIPSIKIVDNIAINACADTSSNEIIIFAGLLDWLMKLELWPFPSTEIGDDVDAHCYALIWVVAHEFFHISRNHYEVMKVHSNPDARMAIEYDADAMAATALYRFLRLVYGKRSPQHSILETKSIVLSCIFTPVRALIGSDAAAYTCGRDKYPPWHARICGIIHKLALVDVSTETNQNLPLFAQHLDSLYKNLRSFIVAHTEENKAQLDSDPLWSFLSGGGVTYDNFIGHLITEHRKILPDINRLKYQRI